MKIEIPVSFGELVDKLTILNIKKDKIQDKEKLKNIDKEYNHLNLIYKKHSANNLNVASLFDSLYDINLKLWDVEDNLRFNEKQNKFNDEFILFARSVYKLNDERFVLKSELNKLVNSEIIEEKSYEDY
tara:strand:+ start:4986 stop:5372 length:387 start_codon:yes stop_codon:yes gene_type:complete